MAPTVRTLDQILSEIGGVYTPQIQSLQTQQADIPNQVRAEEDGLAAKQKSAFGSILSGARRRGTGVAFGGIPLGEQAEYTASTYMPALANLRTAAKQQATSLQDAINQIQERRQSTAIGLQQYDQQRYDSWKQNQDALAESRRQAEAQASNLGSYFNLGGGGGGAESARPSIASNGKGGFDFYGADSKPITAGMYARQTGQDIRDVLHTIGSQGDTGAAKLYNTLRVIKDPNMLNSTINTLAKQYPWVFNGYVSSAPYAPTSGAKAVPAATPAPRAIPNFNQPTSLKTPVRLLNGKFGVI